MESLLKMSIEQITEVRNAEIDFDTKIFENKMKCKNTLLDIHQKAQEKIDERWRTAREGRIYLRYVYDNVQKELSDFRKKAEEDSAKIILDFQHQENILLEEKRHAIASIISK